MSNGAPRYQRSFKNYIVDSRFQLKYTAMTLLASVLIAAPLGVFLFETSGDLVKQSARVAEESRKVSEVLKMQLKNEYADNPELMKTVGGSTASSDAEVVAQQQGVIESQARMRGAVVGGLGLLVVLVTLLGIYFTHKVAGPIYKMKLLLGQVGEGKLNFQGGLRKGDELQSFFEAFSAMVARVKARKAADVEQLDAAVAAIRASAPNADVTQLEALRTAMRASLEA